MNDSTTDAALLEALKNREPRYFRASGGNAHGQTGVDDTSKFAESLMVLQECALLVGERLEMSAVSYVYVYEGNQTLGFKFDQDSNPTNPEVVGAVQNRRVAMNEFSEGLDQFAEKRG